MQITVQAAKEDLSELIDRAKAGEEIILAEGTTPVAMIVAVPKRSFQIGLLREELSGQAPDFFEPMDTDELDLWEGRT
jgi:antitoxin (DNA-binding transcriptional repressor) of toxin-antitoxin stability system